MMSVKLRYLSLLRARKTQCIDETLGSMTTNVCEGEFTLCALLTVSCGSTIPMCSTDGARREAHYP
jgi:hypothetical protein